MHVADTKNTYYSETSSKTLVDIRLDFENIHRRAENHDKYQHLVLIQACFQLKNIFNILSS